MKGNSFLNNTTTLFQDITKSGKLEIKDLIKANDGSQYKANQILES